jgi:hypothetical protein
VVLERALLGFGGVTWRPFPGLPDVQVGVRVPSQTERDAAFVEAEQAIDERVPEAMRGSRRASLIETERRRRLVARSLVAKLPSGEIEPLSIEDVEQCLAPTDVGRLLTMVERADEVASDFPSKDFFAELELFTSNPIERYRARYASSLVAYYGARSARELTPWQVIAHMALTAKEKT